MEGDGRDAGEGQAGVRKLGDGQDEADLRHQRRLLQPHRQPRLARPLSEHRLRTGSDQVGSAAARAKCQLTLTKAHLKTQKQSRYLQHVVLNRSLAAVQVMCAICLQPADQQPRPSPV